MTPEPKKGEEFSVWGFLHGQIDEILDDNGVRMKNGAEFYVHTIFNGDNNGYFYISDQSGSEEPSIDQFDKFTKTVPLVLSDPQAGGRYRPNPMITLEKFIYGLICDNNGKLNGGIWPWASERLLICTNNMPLELSFKPQKKECVCRPCLSESYAFLEAICPRKEQLSKTKLGSDLPKDLKDVYLAESPERVEPFGHWYQRAFPKYISITDGYGWRK